MARWSCQGTTRDGNGRVILGATVSVYLTGTTTVASIYAAEAGGTAVNSVLSSSTNGSFLFFVDDTEYATTQFFRLVISKTGYETRTYDYANIVGGSTGAIVTLSDAQTLTNKTLTTPIIASFYQDAAKTQLMTVPNTTSDTLALMDATQTFTNKTLTTPIIPSFYQDVAKTKLMTVPNTTSDTLVTLAASQTLLGKTLTTPTIVNFVNANHDHKSAAGGGSAGVIQVVNTSTGSVATGTTVIPYDNTIPQKTEGDEYFTRAITPISATNNLIIQVIFNGFSSSGSFTSALFQDTSSDALACAVGLSSNTGYPINVGFVYKMLAGTTSSTTFKVRSGPDTSATLTMNGAGGARKQGGVLISSITIWEVVS